MHAFICQAHLQAIFVLDSFNVSHIQHELKSRATNFKTLHPIESVSHQLKISSPTTFQCFTSTLSRGSIHTNKSDEQLLRDGHEIQITNTFGWCSIIDRVFQRSTTNFTRKKPFGRIPML